MTAVTYIHSCFHNSFLFSTTMIVYQRDDDVLRKDVYTDYMIWFFTRQKAPAMYGPVHIGFLIFIVFCVCFFCDLFRKKENIVPVLAVCGVILCVMEVFKQIFLYQTNGYFDWWRFPFQICSIPMYLCILLPFAKGKIRNTLFSYLDSFCLTGALFALLYPQDMLSTWPIMTIHSFVWHGILVFISALIITHGKEGGRKEFLQACILFLILAGIAEIINTAGAHISEHALPDMFYISPYTRTLQPFFFQIQELSGRNIEIIVYLVFYMLGCACIQYVTYRISKKRHTV